MIIINPLRVRGKEYNLVISHHGNQLSSVVDDAAKIYYAGIFNFNGDGKNEAHYKYNDSGSLIEDTGRGITNIEYDDWNNPKRIQFTNGNVTKYVYSADGQKLRTVHYTAAPNITVASGQTHELSNGEILSVDSTDYIGSLVVRNGMPDMYLFAGGYFKYQSSDDTTPSSGNSTGDLYFYNYDHLGNVREVVNESGKLEQVTNYYPFGAPYSDNRITSMNPKLQPYKYTGKGLDLVHGLNTYDHGARQNYSVLGVWDRVDPLAEKYYNISPYAVCANNPICYSDYNGEIIDTTEISGENLSSYNNMINDLRSHSNLFDELYQYLQKSDQVIKVNYVNNLQDKDNPIDGCFDPVSWTVKFNDSNRNIPSIAFTEEFFHAFQQLNLSQYNGPFNREFEAKIFSTCAEMTLNVPIANYDGMTNFQNNIIFGAYGNGDVPITPTSVSSKSFLDEYKAASDYWAGYNVAHNHGNDYYKIFNMSNPFSLQKIIKLTYENH